MHVVMGPEQGSLSLQKNREALICLPARVSAWTLEVEPRLHFDHASTESELGLPKMIAGDVAIDGVPGTTASQVKFVEQVIEVCAKLDPSVFTDKLHLGNAKRLAECRVDVKVAGAMKRIASDSRFGWQGAKRLPAAWA